MKTDKNVLSANKSFMDKGIWLTGQSGWLTTLLLDIQHGEGGDDSKLFVHDLTAMYVKFAKQQNFQVELLNSTEGHTTLQITGKGVWEVFEHESGKHCVQRIPPTESKGRRQTSMVSVVILPLQTNAPTLNEKDVSYEFKVGGGPGGQHRNRTASTVRALHKPTRITVQIDSRDQHQNRRKALEVLTARVNQLYQDQQDRQYSKERKNQRDGGGRGNKVRTYNLFRGVVTDHRTGKDAPSKQVMKGHLDLLR